MLLVRLPLRINCFVLFALNFPGLASQKVIQDGLGKVPWNEQERDIKAREEPQGKQPGVPPIKERKSNQIVIAAQHRIIHLTES